MLVWPLMAAGCATHPAREPLPLTEAPAFSTTDGASIVPRWWRAFDDATLSEHVERGLASSFGLRAAFERIRAAAALAAREGAALWPQLDLSASGSASDGKNEPPDQFSVGLAASYEVDLWGRIRSTAEAQRLEATATAEDYQAAAVSLSAAIATVVYRLTESAAQLTLIDSQLETNRNVLRVIENRFAIGQSVSADVLRQRQLVEATREQRIVEATTMELLEHQLAVLQGRPPQGAADVGGPAGLPVLPALPAVGLPADLVRRRPDIRAAFARLESADASVAAAVRDQYPRIELGATLVTAGENPHDLFSDWVGSIGGQLLAPLLDGGRRRSEVERTVAVRRQRLAEYGDAVLVAYREVEDALAQERRQSERVGSLDRQLALASRTYTELRNRYLNGAGDFIDVLVALRDQQSLERSLLEARLLCIEFRIALHRAIAGGFAEPMDQSNGNAAQAEREARPEEQS